MQLVQSRRDFLASASIAAAAGVLGGRASLADEGPPEVTTIRLRVEDAPPLEPKFPYGASKLETSSNRPCRSRTRSWRWHTAW